MTFLFLMALGTVGVPLLVVARPRARTAAKWFLLLLLAGGFVAIVMVFGGAFEHDGLVQACPQGQHVVSDPSGAPECAP